MTVLQSLGAAFLLASFFVGFYAWLIRQSFAQGRGSLPWRQCLWLSLTGTLLVLRVIERPDAQTEGLGGIGSSARSREVKKTKETPAAPQLEKKK